MARATATRRHQVGPVGDVNRWFDLTPMEIEGLSPTEGRILDAARRCYVRYGASKMSLNDVAEEANVSRGSVYKYYSNRTELLKRVNDYGIATQMDQIDRSMAAFTTIEDQIVCAAELMRQMHVGRPPIRERTHEDVVARGLTREAGPFLGALCRLVGRYLSLAKARGEVRRDLNIDGAAEWLGRMLLSLVSVPPLTFDLTDTAAVEAFVRSFAIAGLR